MSTSIKSGTHRPETRADRKKAEIVRLASEKAGSVPAHLLEAIQDPNPDVRSAAAWTLGEFSLEEAIPLLLNALDDPDFLVRSSAGWSLVHIGDPARQPVIQGKGIDQHRLPVQVRTGPEHTQ